MNRLVLFFFIFFIAHILPAQRLKVGLFENPPLIYTENGTETGIFIELLKDVAKKEGWQVTYVHAPFDSLLNLLINGDIDVLPDIAYSESRDSLILYNSQTVVPTWGQVFGRDNSVETWLDLDGKKIAYVEGSYYVNDPLFGLKNTLNHFDVEAEFVPLSNIEEVLNQIESETVDYAVLNRINGLYYIRVENDIIPTGLLNATPILFAPVDLKYGFHRNPGRNSMFIEKIDEYLVNQQSNNSSFYYEMLELYVLMPDRYLIPRWIGIAFLAAVLVFGGLAFFNTSLQRRVKVKTVQLQKAYEELRSNEQKLKLAIDGSNEGVFEWLMDEEKLIIDENLKDLLGVGEIGMAEDYKTFRDKVYKDDVGTFRKSFEEYLERGAKSFHAVEFRMTDTKGDARWFSVRGRISEWKNDKPHRYIGTMQDIDDRKAAERVREILLSELKERNKELRCLYNSSQYINDPRKPTSEVLRSIVDLLPESWQYPSYTCARITYKGVQYATDAFTQTQWSQKADINLNGETQGFIEVCYTKEMPESAEGPFLQEERNLINLLAQMISDMIDRQVMDKRIELVESKERERISKELHDGVQQTLTLAAINLNNVQSGLKKEDLKSDLKNKVDLGIEKLTEAISEVRTIAHELDINYVDSVQKLIYDLEDTGELKINFFTNLKQERLEPDIERNLYRITQEAVNNILKHSKASKATIQLMKYPEIVILTVEDDGIGFEQSSRKEKFGLNGIRSRTAIINGTCIIDSAPDKGTSITVEVPLDQ